MNNQDDIRVYNFYTANHNGGEDKLNWLDSSNQRTEQPEYLYRVELFGLGEKLAIKTTRQPNVIQRWMQYVFFGNRWVEI